MTAFFAAIIGLLLPAWTGYAAIRAVERRSPVLRHWERAAYGLLLGLTGTMAATGFAAGFLGMPLSLGWMLGFQLLCAAVATAGWAAVGGWTRLPLPALPPTSLTTGKKATLAVLGAWTALKIVLIGGIFAVLLPTFLDDSLDNWNLRAKVFVQTDALTLQLPGQLAEEVGSGVSSYPPAVPLAKAWLAQLHGGWSEGLANGLHLVWFMLGLLLLAAQLRRHAGWFWAGIGAYALGSLPLFFLHGTNAYADAFLAAHLLAALGPLAHALSAETPSHRAAWLRVSLMGTALLPLTKNEGLLLYLPVLLLLTAASMLWLLQTDRLSRLQALRCTLFAAGCLALTLLPWLIFKWMNGLTFGNAKSVSGFSIGWQPGVLHAVSINTFLEGNWLLLPPLLLLALAWGRRALRTPAVLLAAAFAGMLYFGQLALYLFTSLSAEALAQTGYARGLLHLMPILIFLLILLIRPLLEPAQDEDPLR